MKMPRGHHTTVRPLRLRERDELLAVDRLRGVGYRFSCSCGAVGPVRERHNAARLDGRDHVRAIDKSGSGGP